MNDLIEQLDSNQIYQRLALFLLENESVDDIVWNIAKDVVANLGFEDCVVYILENQKTLVQKAAHGPKNPDARIIKTPITIPVGEGIVGTVAYTGQPELIADTSTDPRYIVDDESRASELAVPIMYNGKVIGVLDSEHSQKDYFTQDHLEHFTTIARLAAPKIFNALAKDHLSLLNKNLHNSSTRYKNLIEQCPDAIVVHQDRQIVYYNQAFADLVLCRHDEDLVSREMWEFIPEKFHTTFLESLVNRSDSVSWCEIELETRYCTHVNVKTSSIPIPYREGEAIQTIFHDITEFKRREKALADATRSAEAANEAKSQFLSRISHELRTPLNAILGFAQLQEIKFPDLPEEAKVGNQEILAAGEHLLALVNDILDISQIEQKQFEIKLKPCDLCTAVESSIALIKAQASEKNIDIVCSNFDYEVVADPTRLKQVIVNLLSNAVKYSHPEGKIVIKAQRLFPHYIELRVSDDGIGISKQEIAAIFEPFTRLKEAEQHSFQGAGVGLTLTKALLEEMNGTIRVESEPNKGSTFIVSFEEAVQASSSDDDWLQQAEDYAFSDIELSVLYVEDDFASRELVKEIFTLFSNINLQTADNGRAALKEVAQKDFDLIMLDMNLPDSTGMSLLPEMKQQCQNAKIIAVSAEALPIEIDRAIAAGFDFYLTKPLKLSELLSYLRLVNSDQRTVNPRKVGLR